jgi:hypothetical protein
MDAIRKPLSAVRAATAAIPRALLRGARSGAEGEISGDELGGHIFSGLPGVSPSSNQPRFQSAAWAFAAEEAEREARFRRRFSCCGLLVTMHTGGVGSPAEQPFLDLDRCFPKLFLPIGGLCGYEISEH